MTKLSPTQLNFYRARDIFHKRRLTQLVYTHSNSVNLTQTTQPYLTGLIPTQFVPKYLNLTSLSQTRLKD